MTRLLKLFRKKRSFTLIELIMTIVVVGIIALPISITLAKHVQSVAVSQDYTTALNLARLDMEQVLNTAYASISSASFSNYQGYAYNLSRTVTYAQGSSGTTESLKLVSISVTRSDSATVLVNLKTYIAKNITLGL
jgi:prepilin-type N-terminal cleavage/methylation domain-containing protein